MTLSTILKNKKISGYRLSKESGVPYMTIHDLVSGKTSITKCSAETVYRIARALGTTCDELLDSYLKERISFELFKSNVCHNLKRLGDLDFILDVLKNDEITYYYNLEWWPECLYLLSMIDYLSRINNLPLCRDYEELRPLKLMETAVPSSILAIDIVRGNDEASKKAFENSIPEFKSHNIIENEVRNVV